MERSASATALGVTVLRAMQRVPDGIPRLLDDPISARFIEPTVRERAVAVDNAAARGLRAHVLLAADLRKIV